MRTVLFLLAGLLLLASFFLLAKLFSANVPGASGFVTGSFIALWLAVTAGNMWVGVSKAGYSATEELPVFLLLFGVPVVLAIVLKWKVL